jgi:hypothetical protein
MASVEARRARPRAWCALLLSLGWLLTACGVNGLGFEDSTHIQDIQPPRFATVKVPFTLSWNAEPLADGQRYLVLVDQDPMAPGASIDDLVDDTCKATKGCPNKAYLDAHYMFETTTNRIKITSVPSAGSYDADDLTNLHHFSIVVLDAHDRRVGEQIWTTDLKVRA